MTAPGDRLLVALAGRLQTVSRVLWPAGSTAPTGDLGDLLQSLTAVVAADPSDDKVWLLLTAVAGAYPTRAEVDRARREFELATPVELSFFLLDHGLAMGDLAGLVSEVELIVGGVVCDVDHTATHNLHTGIQRVAREAIPLLAAEHDLTLARWTEERGGLTGLDQQQRRRVLEWAQIERGRQRDTSLPEFDQAIVAPVRTLLVPWRSVVLLAEVPPAEAADRLAGLAACSGNRVVGIFYDAIPIASADLVPEADTVKFVRYLTAIKFAARLAGISTDASAEIRGFCASLATQGLTGPMVATVPVPSPGLRPHLPAVHPTGPPSVLVIGSHEPRKNHLAVLHAAELLWREGLSFSLDFIGGSGWGDEFPTRAGSLAASGRAITVRRAVPETELERALAGAAFTVFPSWHEGFGLPVAESLTWGTPVITSHFGSTAQIAAAGGCLTVDPRDDDALTAAMRSLLTDPAELARLRAEIPGRPGRTWAQYAHELWAFLIEPELAELHAADGAREDIDA